MGDGGYYTREGDSCKRKFERLWTKDKPTGTTEIPIHIKRAKNIKEKIMAEECMGYSMHNDSEDDGELTVSSGVSRGLKGANLVVLSAGEER